MEATTELKIWLEKALDASANEGRTNDVLQYYRINKLVPRIFVENWKSWIFCSYSCCQPDLIKPRFCLERLSIL